MDEAHINETTEKIDVPKKLIDQVIGQDEAVEIVKKAAQQKRHVILIGEPGTGKSLLAQAMSELLPKEELQDIVIFPNFEDKNMPKVRVFPAGKGKEIVDEYKKQARANEERRKMWTLLLIFGIVGLGIVMKQFLVGIIAAALVFLLIQNIRYRDEVMIPKLLVHNQPDGKPPFVDATGAHAGALFGDVRHDPFQSGGLETPAHERVESGAIHKAHKGVLFIDEIATLDPKSQVDLLTSMQEKKMSITGQSERSSGAMVKTEPVPSDFILVAAGNLDVVGRMHPALRSRIRGSGYEVYMNDTMPDTPENREKLIRFIAQEVVKDGRIPHFDQEATEEIIREAKRRSGRRGHLTLKLRDLGGLIRVAGDIARAERSPFVTGRHVIAAKEMARSLEQQVADRVIERKKEYRVFKTEGEEIGRVNGLAVIGSDSGIILPIAAEVVPAQSRDEGKVIATGKLGRIAKEAVQNVSALVKKYTGRDIRNFDIHVQFVLTHEGVEGDSASISVATAVISALENIPVDQSIGMTGSLSVRGDVLPVGGISAKIEAAIDAGLKKVLIPKANEKDVILDDKYRGKIEIATVENIGDVLKYALIQTPRKNELLTKIKDLAEILPESIAKVPGPKPA
ncbi:MAG: ATP-dependent protease LonB [Candidatus Hydrothermarchaeota archaeon]